MAASIFWYDYETTGINPRADRPVQVAGLRTDEALNVIGEPLNLYCRLSDDILPHPAACLVTGLSPQILQEKGLDEGEFMARIHQQLALPGTCGAGYNSLRFDDEVTRYSLYRNFYDPYGREWQGGNSRWDLIDLVRTTCALRPDGIEWPMDEDGNITLKLERLTQANGLDHGQAHDALSDVYATIALARLIRQRQPRLYDYLYQLRSKHRVMDAVRLLQPLLHVSGRFSAQRHYLAPVLPLAWHPRNRNALIVCDLMADPAPLLSEDAETLRQRLYQRRDTLSEGELPVPLKLVHINKCPVLVTPKVLREQDRQRLHWDQAMMDRHLQSLLSHQAIWQDKLSAIYQQDEWASSEDPEQQLYDGFLNERDRRLCEDVRNAEPDMLARNIIQFDDIRLPELLFRYRARNFPGTLSEMEKQRWLEFCRLRLQDQKMGAPITAASFFNELDQLRISATESQQSLLSEWQLYGKQLMQRLGMQ